MDIKFERQLIKVLTKVYKTICKIKCVFDTLVPITHFISQIDMYKSVLEYR